MNNKPTVHFTQKTLLNPANPITVHLIGAGGTGSQVLTALARINASLVALGHAGLFVRLFDDDTVTSANLGRQLFAASETGLNKAVALINRLNRFFGTNWKAVPAAFDRDYVQRNPETACANLTISCVDTVPARFDIAEILKSHRKGALHVDRSYYWMDFGNSRYSGQVILSSVGNIEQPKSKKFDALGTLPFITDEFPALLKAAGNDNTPSCSLAEALTKQDLFINSALANAGASLLWQLFREGMTGTRGFFLNLKDFRMQPLGMPAKVVGVNTSSLLPHAA